MERGLLWGFWKDRGTDVRIRAKCPYCGTPYFWNRQKRKAFDTSGELEAVCSSRVCGKKYRIRKRGNTVITSVNAG